ncbi:MAG: hypothetical protein OXR66_01010 [Candidatus Woesearchaeota archaeon]|nr:hypothetical protein [Candidatus Woesearchaeota archaeon]
MNQHTKKHFRTTSSIAILLVFALALGVLAAKLLFTHWYVLDQYEIPVQFKVVAGPHIGFDVNNSLLIFGKIPQGGSGSRSATLAASVRATAVIQSDVPWLEPSVDKVALLPHQEENIGFTVRVPGNATPGNYTGSVRITYVRRLI